MTRSLASSHRLGFCAVFARNEAGVGELDGVWIVRRTAGLLPPLPGVRKRIAGGRGSTCIGPLPGAEFEVVGCSLRYVPPFSGFVDLLERETAERYRGRATFRGREFGRFVMNRER
jgi:hypothetical protein